MKKSRIIFVLLILLLSCMVFTFALAEEKVTLRVLLYTTQPPASMHDELIEKFEKENPNISISVRRVPFGELYRQTTISVASDDPPDVFYVDGPMTASYAYNKILLPLDDYYTEEELKDFLLASIKEGSYNGKLYSVPERQSAIALFYNKDYTDAAGIYPPKELENAWTWPEFLEVLKKVTKRDEDGNVQTWGLTQVSKHTLYSDLTIIRSAGQSKNSLTYKAISDDKTTVSGYLDSPEAKEAFQFLQDLHQKYKVTPLEQTPDMFENGMSVFHMSPGHTSGRLEKEFPDLNWGVTPLPYFNTPITHTGSFHFGVSRKTEHPDEAVQFVKFMTNTENSKYFYEGVLQLPARFSVFEQIDRYDDYPLKIFYDSMVEWGEPRPRMPAYREYESLVNDMLKNINLGEDVDKALDYTVKKINNILLRYSR